MTGDLTHLDPADDADARARAMSGADLTALESHLPTEEDQDLLDYAHGADLHLPGLIDYIRMNGALAGMVERQSRAIAANQLEIRQLREALKVALRKIGGGGGP